MPVARQPRMFQRYGLFQEHNPDNDHYYLPAIGTAADRWTQGIGSALLRPVLDRCDHENIPAYLESTSERNRALYLRHGFEVIARSGCPMDPAFGRLRKAR